MPFCPSVRTDPILREAHHAEPDGERPVRDANEQLVEVFYLSVEATGLAPSASTPGAAAACAMEANGAPEVAASAEGAVSMDSTRPIG